MNHFVKAFGKIFASIVFTIGIFASQGACFGLYHQPDMPEELAKKFA